MSCTPCEEARKVERAEIEAQITGEETIFIQIASYRDPELLPTLRDCIKNAKHPENLRFGICWQHSPEDDWDNLIEFKDDPRFRIVDVNYLDSQGACWARNKLQQEYQDETYTLQLDSHHRFIENWDYECIYMIKQLQRRGFPKPLLTSYISSYDPANDPEKRIMTPWKMIFDRFIPEGAVFFLPTNIENWEGLHLPVPSRFYSAHFCFTLGQFAREVQHDPDYYFHGEEISIAVRAYTHGYDLFHPHKIIAWHEYTRVGRVKQWDDDKDWGPRNDKCHLKNRKLFEMDGEKRDIDFGIYGFGTERTLEDYERYSGLNFGRRAVQQYTLDNQYPPNPYILDPQEYYDSFLEIFKHCIDLFPYQVPKEDYDFWAVIFEDKDGNSLHRQDLNKDDIAALKASLATEEYYKIWRSFPCKGMPYKWIVWPHSESEGWCDRVDRLLMP